VKTEFALLLMTEGRPVMHLAEVASMLGIGERTAENQIYRKDFPIVVFKAGSRWVAHVSDVAKYIDAQRADATNLLQHPLKAA
jgi:hypothetical protein